MGGNVLENENYSLLRDFKLEIEVDEGKFGFCFWVYLTNATPLPHTVLEQALANGSGSLPFLLLNEKRGLMLFPLLQSSSHKEAADCENLWSEILHASIKSEFPLEKWVHVGCEVSNDILRLYIDGEIGEEMPLTSSLIEHSGFLDMKKITTVSIKGDNDAQGYVHSVEILPPSASIKDLHTKNPPVQLTIDNSSASEIEEDSDGVWSIVGGKASCRRNFSLDVVLLDASGQSVNKEFEIVASLLYADTGAPVEKTSDNEAPLLTSCDGIEYASCDIPSKLLEGRASFKLKISQLSSKCDNRLFRIRFDIPKFQRCPFLEALSRPIRCISRSRNTRIPTVIWKKPTSAIHLINGCQSPMLDDGCFNLQHHTVREAKHSPSSKRVRLGQENIPTSFMSDYTKGKCDQEYNSYAWNINQVKNMPGSTLEGRAENYEETDKSGSDSESTEAENVGLKNTQNRSSIISDSTIFRFCLGSLKERSLLLKEISTSASDEELAVFADQVSLYSGCSHHRNQILIAKGLIQEGIRVWDIISQKNHHVPWEAAIFEIEEQFMKSARCSTRSLVQQDFEVLRRLAGCQEYLTQENFEKLWSWLYPVALTLSRDCVKALWCSVSPKWIEGFITKEEAESSLRSPRGYQESGTFILRFPTSRSWPHPDAGSLVVTYVGSNHTIRHRLLSLDCLYGSREKGMNTRSLQDMLLNEPELLHLGRVVRAR